MVITALLIGAEVVLEILTSGEHPRAFENELDF